MKKQSNNTKPRLIILTLFLKLSGLYAGETHRVLIKNVTPTEYEDMIEIQSEGPIDRVILDCQGFIQGITYYGQDENLGHYIVTEEDCHKALYEIRKTAIPPSTKCLELDIESGVLSTSNEQTSCRSDSLP